MFDREVPDVAIVDTSYCMDAVEVSEELFEGHATIYFHTDPRYKNDICLKRIAVYSFIEIEVSYVFYTRNLLLSVHPSSKDEYGTGKSFWSGTLPDDITNWYLIRIFAIEKLAEAIKNMPQEEIA